MCGLFIIQPRFTPNVPRETVVSSKHPEASRPLQHASVQARVNAIMGVPSSQRKDDVLTTQERNGKVSMKPNEQNNGEVYICARKNSYTTLQVESKANDMTESQPYHITARKSIKRRSASRPLANIFIPSPVSSIDEQEPEDENPKEPTDPTESYAHSNDSEGSFVVQDKYESIQDKAVNSASLQHQDVPAKRHDSLRLAI